MTKATTTPTWLIDALAGPCRGVVVDFAIRQGSGPYVAQVIETLDAGDARLVEWAVRLKPEASDLLLELLEHPQEEIRAATALGFRTGNKRHGPLLPAAWAPLWVSAFLSVKAREMSVMTDYELREILAGLSTDQPEVVEAWVAHALAANPDSGVFLNLPHDAKEYLPNLPRDTRDRLLRGFRGLHGRRYLLEALLGQDHEWAQALLSDGAINADELLHALSGRTGPTLERFIPLLIESGVPPATVARMAQFNVVHMGPQSSQYAALRAYFSSLRESRDQAVAQVGQEGEALYAAAEQTALKDERLERIRGD
jgi:hypothetical protein